MIPTLRRLRQEEFEFEAILGYRERTYIKKKVKLGTMKVLEEKRGNISFRQGIFG
jgi:hypothetical protein